MAESLRDPAGLVERAPEIVPLANADAAVRRALGRGDLHGLYRTLWWARLLGRLKEHRATLDSLLMHRRLFATPVRRTPVLQTVNGIGASVYGSSEHDADGSYFKTHFLVFVFLPVVPLSQYLVKDGSEGRGKSWYFLAKVPMSPLLRLWNRLVVAAVLCGLAFGAVRTFHVSRHHDVIVVNSLPGPVHVTIGSTRYDVPSNQRRSASIPTGTHPVTVTDAAGHTLEKSEMRVEAGTQVLAWNVLGASPIYERIVLYGSGGNLSAQEEAVAEPRYHCGESALGVVGVDYAFADPPSTVSLSSGQKLARRRHLGIGQGGLETCASILFRAHKPKPALALAKALSAFDDASSHLTALASGLYRSAGKPDEALLLTRQAVAKHPGSVEHHRLYQGMAEDMGKVAELREEYRARYAAAPESPDAGYLYARVLPNPEALALGSSLLQRFPSHVPLIRLVVFGSVRRLQFTDALPLLERLRQLDAKEWMGFGEEHVTVLAGLGRREEARKLAQEAFAVADPQRRLRLAGIDGWLSGSPGAGGETLFLKLGAASPAQALRYRIRFWRTGATADLALLKGDPDQPTYGVMQHAHYDPAAALDAAAKVQPEGLAWLDPEVLVLLLAESMRSGHAQARERLEAAALELDVPVPAIHAYLEQGTWSDAVDQMGLSVHGALHLVRSRSASLSAGERARLRDLASRSDPLGGYVHQALGQWPAP